MRTNDAPAPFGPRTHTPVRQLNADIRATCNDNLRPKGLTKTAVQILGSIGIYCTVNTVPRFTAGSVGKRSRRAAALERCRIRLRVPGRAFELICCLARRTAQYTITDTAPCG